MMGDTEGSAPIAHLIELGQAAQASERAMALRAIGEWLERRDDGSPNWSAAEAHRAIHDLLSQVRALIEPVIGKAIGSLGAPMLGSMYDDAEDYRNQQLVALRKMLSLASPLLDGQISIIPTYEVLDELDAVSSGDLPRLFASRATPSGRPRNAFRLARMQLRALEWDRVLAKRGLSASKRQNAIATAFGVTWDAVTKWKASCKKYLGELFVADAMEMASSNAETGQPVFMEIAGIGWSDAIGWDGRRYREELASRKTRCCTFPER